MVRYAGEQMYQQLNYLAGKEIFGVIIVDVKVFGAKGDGVTDDTAAIQRAINYAISIGKHEVVFPAGTYLYTTLTDTSGITFIGDGVTLDGTTPITLVSFATLKADVATKLPYVYVDTLGAVGDGITNDTIAFQQASDIINLAGGGTIVLSNKTYIVGLQTFYGESGHLNSYAMQPIIKITNCTKAVFIQGNGAKLKAANGLKFGSFDPVTGAIYEPVLPFTNYNYRADAYQGINLENNFSVTISDIEFDGNMDNLTIGGLWGDAGRQCWATAVRMYQNQKVKLNNIYAHHNALDGFSVSSGAILETDARKPHLFENITSEYNGRQGISWTGGNCLTVINGKFNHTGKGIVASSPMSGLDIEATSSICRNGLFINCEFVNNASQNMVADSGDSSNVKFEKCLFWGSNNSTSVWPRKPRYVFEDCTIYGRISSVYGDDNPILATKFIRCHIEDRPYTDGIYPVFSYLVDCSAQNSLFEKCTFIANKNKLIAINDNTKIITLKDCTLVHKDDSLADAGFVALLRGARLENVRFTGTYATPPATGYYLSIGTVYLVSSVIVDGNGLRWEAASLLNGVTGTIGDNLVEPKQFLSVMKRNNDNSRYGIKLIGTINVLPTTGNWTSGDILFKDTAVAGDVIGWVCTTNGTFGTLVGITGDITSGTTQLTVNSITGLTVGSYISIVGVSGIKRITNIVGLVVTIDSNAGATVSGAAISNPAPVFQTFGTINLQASATWDPGSLVDGAGETSSSITVTGAALGDFVMVSAPYDLQGITCNGYVSSSNNVKIRIQNETGVTIDLASGTWRVKVIKQ